MTDKQQIEKEIREMERIGSTRPCKADDCSNCLAMNRRCNDFLFAERLYNAGYRKVGEDETVVKANKYKRLVSTLKDLKAMAHYVDDYQDDIIADYRNLAESYMNQIIEELLSLEF